MGKQWSTCSSLGTKPASTAARDAPRAAFSLSQSGSSTSGHGKIQQVKTCKTMLLNNANHVLFLSNGLTLWFWFLSYYPVLPWHGTFCICCQCCRPFSDRVNCQPSRSFLRSWGHALQPLPGLPHSRKILQDLAISWIWERQETGWGRGVKLRQSQDPFATHINSVSCTADVKPSESFASEQHCSVVACHL